MQGDEITLDEERLTKAEPFEYSQIVISSTGSLELEFILNYKTAAAVGSEMQSWDHHA